MYLLVERQILVCSLKSKNMKKAVLLALVSISIFACKKDKNAGGPDAIYGYWTGTWKEKGRDKEYSMAAVLRSNGTARIIYGYNGTDTTGAYYITEDHFTYEDSRVKFVSRETGYLYIYEGKASGNSMTGTWGTSPSVDDGGTWKLSKQ